MENNGDKQPITVIRDITTKYDIYFSSDPTPANITITKET